MVQLIWEATCPNIEAARASLRRALEENGRPIRWGEWDVDDPLTPDALRGYGSPTVLVGDRDVAGDAPAGHACCRLYEQPDGTRSGAPTATLIAAAIEAAEPAGWRGFPWIETERTVVTVAGPSDAAAMLDYVSRNREHLNRWAPTRPDDFYTLGFWTERLPGQRAEFLNDVSACFAARRKGSSEVVAIANLTNFVRGPFQACHLGYSIDHAHEGQGLMAEVLRGVVDFAFDELRLHRVMANYLPENERSGRLLERLGFEREGYARNYLYIDGAWRDHVLTARVNDAL